MTLSCVRLVLIDGVPLYGNLDLMQRLWGPLAVEELSIAGRAKALATAAAEFVVTTKAARLQAALQAEAGRSHP